MLDPLASQELREVLGRLDRDRANQDGLAGPRALLDVARDRGELALLRLEDEVVLVERFPDLVGDSDHCVPLIRASPELRTTARGGGKPELGPADEEPRGERVAGAGGIDDVTATAGKVRPSTTIPWAPRLTTQVASSSPARRLGLVGEDDVRRDAANRACGTRRRRVSRSRGRRRRVRRSRGPLRPREPRPPRWAPGAGSSPRGAARRN